MYTEMHGVPTLTTLFLLEFGYCFEFESSVLLEVLSLISYMSIGNYTYLTVPRTFYTPKTLTNILFMRVEWI